MDNDTTRIAGIALVILTAGSYVYTAVSIPSSVTTTATVTRTTSITTTTVANQASIDALSVQVGSLESSVASLNKTNFQLQDQVYRLELPANVSSRLNISTLVSYMVNPLKTEMKSQVPPILSPLGIVIDGAGAAIQATLEIKAKHFDLQLQNIAVQSPGVYVVSFTASDPISLAEIPVLSTVQNAIGDVTFYVQIPGTVVVNFNTRTIGDPQFSTNGITVGI
jgi:hypothetical protein